MRRTQLLTAGLTATALAAATLVAPTTAQAAHGSDGPQVVLDWERIAVATIYPATPIPSGVPILGFT